MAATSANSWPRQEQTLTAPVRIAYTIADGNGGQRAPTFNYDSASLTPVTTVLNAIGAMSNCYQIMYTTTTVSAGYVPAGYSNGIPVPDTAKLVFQCADGSPVEFFIPGFDYTGYLTDQETVDPSTPNVAAFIAAVTGNCLNAVGSPVTGYLKGYRVWVPQRSWAI